MTSIASLLSTFTFSLTPETVTSRRYMVNMVYRAGGWDIRPRYPMMGVNRPAVVGRVNKDMDIGRCRSPRAQVWQNLINVRLPTQQHAPRLVAGRFGTVMSQLALSQKATNKITLNQPKALAIGPFVDQVVAKLFDTSRRFVEIAWIAKCMQASGQAAIMIEPHCNFLF